MKSNKNLIIGGGIAAGAVGLLAYFLLKSKDSSTSKNQAARHVNRELVMKILKEVDKEMFSVLTNMAMVATQIKEQSRNRVSNQELRDFMLNQNKELREEIQATIEKVMDKYGLEEQDLRTACEVTYKDDKEIKAHLNEAKLALEKATTGTAPDVRTTLPPFLTAELTLQLLEKIMRESLNKIKDKFLELKNAGISLSYNNPQLLMALHELKLDDIKKNVLHEAQLDKFDDPATKIFQYATQKYTQENPHNFNKKLMQLEFKHQKAMEALMKDPEGSQNLIDSIGDHLNQKDPVPNKPKLLAESEFQIKTGDDQEEDRGRPMLMRSNSNLTAEERSLLADEFKNMLASNAELPENFVNQALHTLKLVFEGYEKGALSRSQSMVKDASEKDKENDKDDWEDDKSAEENQVILEDKPAPQENGDKNETDPEAKEDDHAHLGVSATGKDIELTHNGDNGELKDDEDNEEN